MLRGMSVRDVLGIMGHLDHLPKPFNSAVPYYVDNAHANQSLKCWTQNRADGGITCFVRIPRARYALKWLERVNGTCGPEHALLERDVALLDNDAWRLLADVCRQRLTVWARFEPGELFQLYLGDADFGSRDAGLAGLVLTDRRIIYCKYHHRGVVYLSDDATIIITPQDDFAHVSLEARGLRSRLVKLYLADVPRLTASLAVAPRLRVEVQGRSSAAKPTARAGASAT